MSLTFSANTHIIYHIHRGECKGYTDMVQYWNKSGVQLLFKRGIRLYVLSFQIKVSPSLRSCVGSCLSVHWLTSPIWNPSAWCSSSPLSLSPLTAASVQESQWNWNLTSSYCCMLTNWWCVSGAARAADWSTYAALALALQWLNRQIGFVGERERTDTLPVVLSDCRLTERFSRQIRIIQIQERTKDWPSLHPFNKI